MHTNYMCMYYAAGNVYKNVRNYFMNMTKHVLVSVSNTSTDKCE